MTNATLAPTTYAVDADHSSVGFAVRHMSVSTFRGAFAEVDAAVVSGEDGIRITGSAPVEGISVRSPLDLRAHLLGEDFFDAVNHPRIAFETDAFIPRPDGRISVRGRLTIRNVTREVNAVGTFAEPVEDPFGGVRGAIELQTVVDRRDYGMAWNLPLPKGGDALGTDIAITAHLELVQQ